jgi:hypothetical protein
MAPVPAPGFCLHKPTQIPMIVALIPPAITAMTVVSTPLAITLVVHFQAVYTFQNALSPTHASSFVYFLLRDYLFSHFLIQGHYILLRFSIPKLVNLLSPEAAIMVTTLVAPIVNPNR